MNLYTRLAGAFLLFFAGAGSGMTVYYHHKMCWQQLHSFAKLLSYLEGLLSYQALTGADLLQRAAFYPEFSQLDLEHCHSLDDLPIPRTAPETLRLELSSGLMQLALEPRDQACATLQRLAALTEEEAQRKRDLAFASRKLYPRLGACAGLLAAILLW